MEVRGLVSCLNPRLVTGRLFSLTPRGGAAVAEVFGIAVEPTPGGIDWRRYAWVVRAKVRRLTLGGLECLESRTGQAQTATAIRKHLKTDHPVGLNPVLRALKDLVRLGLVREAGATAERGLKRYGLTPAGKRVWLQLCR